MEYGNRGFQIRSAAAATLFLLVIFWDMTGSAFVGIPPENIYKAVAFDFGKVIELFVTVVLNNK